MLNHRNLANSIKILDKHNFFLTTNLLSSMHSNELERHYPSEGFTLNVRESGDKKHYQLNILPAIEQDHHTAHYVTLHPLWQQLITQITSPQYINQISLLANLQNTNYNISVGFYMYEQGGWISPHIDNPGKLFTQIFYFNHHWDINWGGKLNLLSSADPEDIILSVPPLSMYTATIFRSDKAWHSVEPIVAAQSVKRLSLQLEVLIG